MSNHPRFIHQKACPAYGFLSLAAAQKLKRSGNCICDVPGVGPIHTYRCKHCGLVVRRESEKQWIKSYCDIFGKDVHLVRVS